MSGMEAMFGGVPVNMAPDAPAAAPAAPAAPEIGATFTDSKPIVRQRNTQAALIAAAKAKSNGTRAYLIAQHKGPDTSPTSGADYGENSPEKVAKSFNDTHDHAISQWQAGKGAVGPTGKEGYFPAFNDPTHDAYQRSQEFAYQHDMQATDAELQAHTPEQKKKYADANWESAKQGMWVLVKGGTLKESLAKTQQIFKDAGFPVRQNYSK